MHKIPTIAKAILSKNVNSERITVPNFKIYYRAIVKKTAWSRHKTDMKINGKS
jgi:hypothetical protein